MSNDPSLREYLERRIEHERELREANERATALAVEVAVNARESRLVTRDQLDARMAPIERQTNRWSGGTAALVVAFGIALAIVAFVAGRMG